MFFAERKVSLGFDWHPECLRCEECGKRLNPGQHAEHKGIPYCHVPCYGALFGPQLFGHGTRVEAHKSYGAPNSAPKPPAGPQIPRQQLDSKLKLYNDFFEDKSSQRIKSREVNGRLVLEGALKVFWGVAGVIHLKEDCDQRTVVTVRKRNSWRSTRNSLYPDLSSERAPLIQNSDQMVGSTNSVDDNDTTISESLSYDTLSMNSDIHSITSNENSPVHKANGNGQIETEEIIETKLENAMEELLQSSASSAQDPSQYHSLTESSATLEKKSPTDENSTSLYDDYETPPSTLKPTDYEEFRDNVEKQYIHEANMMQSTHDGTLKSNQPIDPSRINDSLKLYGENVLRNGLSDCSIQVLALPKANLVTGCLDPVKINDTFNRLKQGLDILNSPTTDEEGTLKHPLNCYKLQKSESDSSATATPVDSPQHNGVARSKSGPNCYGTLSSDDESDTLRPHPNSARTIYLKMDCYDDLESPTSPEQLENGGYMNEDGVVLRRPPKQGSTAIKRRSGNRRSRTKIKRRCSINGHFYNRETSFFTPPRGSQMSVWVTSLTSTQEIINLLLEKYKVESKAENFALFVVKDNGEQRRLGNDEFPLVSRLMLGPHEDVSKIFLMDSHATPEISNEVAQFLNLSIPECKAILVRYEEEQDREIFRIKLKYDELRRRIQSRMESLKVRL